MKKALLITGLTLLGVTLVLQIFQADRSNPPVDGPLQVADDVAQVLRTSCYDCHSNETVWPWYSYVNPVGWLVAGHVRDGRRQVNFSRWQSYELEQREKIKEEIIEVIEAGAMPLPSYLLMHGDAALTEEEISILFRWASQSGDAG